jgi:hypothetical protein
MDLEPGGEVLGDPGAGLGGGGLDDLDVGGSGIQQ